MTLDQAKMLLALLVFSVFLIGSLALDQRDMVRDSNHQIKVQQEVIDGLRKDLGACQGFMRGY